MSGNLKQLKGILPAPITPFAEDGSIRLDLYEKLIAYMVKAGVNGFFAAGTTAEGPTLTSQERVAVFRIVKEQTSDDQLRCVVVAAPDTHAVLRQIDDIAPEQPDFISAVSPFYFSATQSDIIGHYTRIADHSPVPILLYNIPQNTHNPMTLDTILELGQHPNIRGVKDSSGAFAQFQQGVLGPQPENFTWIQGDDLYDGPSMLLGVRCIVTGLANVWAEPHVAMYAAAREGNHEEILAQQRRINALAAIIRVGGGNVIAAIKVAATLLGRSTIHLRIPSMDLTGSRRTAVEKVIRDLGLA